MKRYAIVVLTALALLISGLPAAAIIDGEPDGDGHPNVALVYVGNGSCTGTLIAPTVLLTAAHCKPAGGPVLVTFDSVLGESPRFVDGTLVPHPDFGVQQGNDVAVVVLDKRMRGIALAKLPERGRLDDLARQRGLQDVTFTTVGYGVLGASHAGGELHEIVPDVFRRRVATTQLVFFACCNLLVMTGAPGTGGGICHGDSGGPSFLGDSATIGAVTLGIPKSLECDGVWTRPGLTRRRPGRSSATTSTCRSRRRRSPTRSSPNCGKSRAKAQGKNWVIIADVGGTTEAHTGTVQGIGRNRTRVASPPVPAPGRSECSV